MTPEEWMKQRGKSGTVAPVQPPEPPAPPSIAQKAWNLAASLGAFVADGFRTVTKEEYEQRLTICEACPNRKDNNCQLCGCHISLKAKGRAFVCPDNPPRWPSLNGESKVPDEPAKPITREDLQQRIAQRRGAAVQPGQDALTIQYSKELTAPIEMVILYHDSMQKDDPRRWPDVFIDGLRKAKEITTRPVSIPLSKIAEMFPKMKESLSVTENADAKEPEPKS